MKLILDKVKDENPKSIAQQAEEVVGKIKKAVSKPQESYWANRGKEQKNSDVSIMFGQDTHENDKPKHKFSSQFTDVTDKIKDKAKEAKNWVNKHMQGNDKGGDRGR